MSSRHSYEPELGFLNENVNKLQRNDKKVTQRNDKKMTHNFWCHIQRHLVIISLIDPNVHVNELLQCTTAKIFTNKKKQQQKC